MTRTDKFRDELQQATDENLILRATWATDQARRMDAARAPIAAKIMRRHLAEIHDEQARRRDVRAAIRIMDGQR